MEPQLWDLLRHIARSALQGGDSGPAVVAGKPEESLLIQVVGYAFDIKMPPKSKLPAAEIDASRGVEPIGLQHELYGHPAAPVGRDRACSGPTGDGAK